MCSFHDRGKNNLGPCGRCSEGSRMPPVVISGEMGEEASGKRDHRLFVFYRCLSFCNSSRLHLGGDIVVALTIRHGGAVAARVLSEPLALYSKTSYRPQPCHLGPCGRCSEGSRMPPVVISGEMGEETSGTRDHRLFVFYRCLSFCNSSRLHLGGDVVVALTIRRGEATMARVLSEPLALYSKTSYRPQPCRGLKVPAQSDT
eukprot:m51a1_g7053 hypothetical protein (202) ;mRNA; r:154901-160222